METNPINTQETTIEITMKNSWWTKTMLHFFMLCIALDVVYSGPHIMDIVVTLFWIRYVPAIQMDRLILSEKEKNRVVLLVLLNTVITYSSILKGIYWISSRIY